MSLPHHRQNRHQVGQAAVQIIPAIFIDQFCALDGWYVAVQRVRTVDVHVHQPVPVGDIRNGKGRPVEGPLSVLEPDQKLPNAQNDSEFLALTAIIKR